MSKFFFGVTDSDAKLNPVIEVQGLLHKVVDLKIFNDKSLNLCHIQTGNVLMDD